MLRIVSMTLLLSCLVSGGVQAQASLPLMPLPAQVKPGDGVFLVTNGFGITLQGFQEPRLERAKQRFLNMLSKQTGIPLWREAVLNQPSFFINTKGPSAAVQQVDEDESYHLQISATEVHLEAANPLGVLHGLQTFLQLVRITPRGFVVPAMTIDDQPRFLWRGLMLDVSRHFQPLDVVYRTLDGMEAVKMNVFHWHLSDNQGFRVESKVSPLLQEKGSDGLFYTQEQIRDVIAYARDRGIRVMPEFEMPGHATAWFVGYPDLASGSGPYNIERKWGVFDPAMDPTRDSTYSFLDALIGEMAALFPDAYFHVGGDENDGKEWDRNPRIQQFMKDHGIKDNAGLQAYFSTKVQKIVAGHGKIMVGWDEVLQPDTPKDVVIQSWRGPQFVGQAVKGGNRALLSAGYYIDLNHSAAEHYAADPEGDGPTTLSDEDRKMILGGEATMWSEFVTPENIDSRIWPRTAAIAERLWSPRNTRDVASMYTRMAIISQKLNYYGLQHNSSYPAMLSRMTGEADPLPLRVLGDVVQPPRNYERGQLREYDAFSPLNHLIDAVPPESDTARQFLDVVDRIIAGKASREDWEQAQEWLVLWRDNDAQLQPLLPKSELTKELEPVSTNLHLVSQAGLDAVGYLREHHHAPVAWKTREVAFLKQSEKPQAVLLNMVAPAVLKLVQATTTP
ncbi:MAG: hexosaminidase [Acidobacteriaceae bacterium]|nr:hexosaminidase [Acidobacteriaceae bacterium]